MEKTLLDLIDCVATELADIDQSLTTNVVESVRQGRSLVDELRNIRIVLEQLVREIGRRD